MASSNPLTLARKLALIVSCPRCASTDIVTGTWDWVSSEVVDISGGFPETPGMLSNWASADQEVLILGFVPPEAIFWP